jgi:hypothetical protein
MKEKIPKCVLEKREEMKGRLGLILLLDHKDASIEIDCRSEKQFNINYIDWKKIELPSLRKSIYKLYVVNNDTITEN